jgi:CHAT domain-containing protein
VPDGALSLLSWAALPTDDGRFLAEAGPTFHYLSNERDLVRSNPSRGPGRGLMVVGAPAFDDPTGFASLSAPPPVRAASMEPPRQGAEPLSRGAGCGAFSGVHFDPLPGSEREAQGVASLWDASTAGNDERATLLLGSAAQEAAFKASAPSRRVVHLATHGFFYDGSCPPSNAANRGVGGLVKQGDAVAASVRSGEAPQSLSGLALAGANHRNAARESEEDGILTADEISTMDLSGVEWAVLSGCDTGVGEVKASEGVFGIRRAFQAAGVGSLIMSLWPVGDESAESWMLALYEARLKQGMPTADAVRAASRRLLESRRAAGVSTHPAHWAPFVSAGAWQ